MALNTTPEQTSALDAALQNVSGAAAQPQMQPQQPYMGVKTQSVLTDRHRLFGRTTAGEAVSKYAESIKKLIIENVGERSTDIKLTILDNKVRLTVLSAILLSYRQGKNVVFHRLLVEGSGQISNSTIQINNQPVERLNTPGDVDNGVFVGKAMELVKAEWGNNIENLFDAGSQVLPTELDAADIGRMRQVIFNAFSALQSTMEDVTGAVSPFSIPTHIERTDILTAKADFHPMPVETAAGLPVRSDIALILNATTSQNPDALQNQSATLTRIDGYINLEYMPPAPPAYGQMPSMRHFVPHFIMTRLTSQTNTESLEQQLFALSVASLLNKDRLWANTFKPRIDNSGAVNLRDLGAIGLEIPALTGAAPGTVGSRIDTSSTMFGMNDLHKLVNETIHDGLVYSLDVEECGELSWLNTVFIAAAMGSPVAVDFLYRAANNLTGGEFSRQFTGGFPMIMDSGNRIHLGYYIDEMGNKRDLRDIDYLAMLNLNGDKGLESAHAWAATFENINVPEDIRLNDRLHMMRAVNPSVVVKGYARRIDFSAPFMAALDRACQIAGLTIRGNVAQGMVGMRQRGFTNMEMLSVPPVVGSVFQFGGPQYNGGYRYQAPVSRWNR